LRPPHHGCCHDFLRHNKLTVATIAAVVAGITLGVLLRPLGPFSKRNIMYINFPGEVFLRMLRGLILPLITSSMVAAVGSLDARLSGKIGLRAVVYYFTTTFMAIVLGIVLVLAIQPGSGDSKLPASGTSKARLVTTADTLMDLIRRETDLAFSLTVRKKGRIWVGGLVVGWEGGGGGRVVVSTAASMYDWDFQTVSDPGTNILGLIVFCIALGATVGRMGDSGKPLLDMFTSLSDAMMIITKLVVWFSPVGVMFLVMAKMLAMEDFSVVAGQVGMYSLTVLLGLFLHGFIVLPLIYSIVMRKAPFLFLMDMMQAIATAFGTASRQEIIAVLFRCVVNCHDEEDDRMHFFIFCIFRQQGGKPLYLNSFHEGQSSDASQRPVFLLLLFVTATAASIGAAGIPQAGLVTMVMVLNAVGLPADDITLIIVVDWIL
ncbi:glutamate transporter, putative, partial [Ixodes scapularis]